MTGTALMRTIVFSAAASFFIELACAADLCGPRRPADRRQRFFLE